MSEANGHREHLEQRAEQVRAKLERRLKLIDERRQRVAEVARSALHPPASIALFAAAGVAAALFLVYRVRARHARTQRFWKLLQPASAPPEKSVFVQSIGKAATSLAVLAVKRVGQRGLDRWLAEPSHAHQQRPNPSP